MQVDNALARVTDGHELTAEEMRGVIHSIMSGTSSPDLIGNLLTALHERGETIDEVTGAAQAMRDLAVELPRAPNGAIDTAGTGGDNSNSFNISTTAAIVAAGAGVPVAKHGNRAATSATGSAELLEELGIRIDIDPRQAAAAVAEVGIGFLYARACHPAMAAVAPIRSNLGHPTIFNRLGPLTNPMFVKRQLLGVSRPDIAQGTVDALHQLGSERVWVVHSDDGMDEISTVTPTQVHALEDGATRRFTIDPAQFVAPAKAEDLRGGDPARNAGITAGILAGQSGPRRDVVLLNAAAALCVAGTAHDLEAGLDMAGQAIDSGAAATTLDRWVAFTEAAAGA